MHCYLIEARNAQWWNKKKKCTVMGKKRRRASKTFRTDGVGVRTVREGRPQQRIALKGVVEQESRTTGRVRGGGSGPQKKKVRHPG